MPSKPPRSSRQSRPCRVENPSGFAVDEIFFSTDDVGIEKCAALADAIDLALTAASKRRMIERLAEVIDRQRQGCQSSDREKPGGNSLPGTTFQAIGKEKAYRTAHGSRRDGECRSENGRVGRALMIRV